MLLPSMRPPWLLPSAEEDQEREADRTYWAPLRLELEELRRTRRG